MEDAKKIYDLYHNKLNNHSINMRIAWGITGSGDKLTECVSLMEELTNKYNLEVHVYLSREGKAVLKFYKLLKEVKEQFPKVSPELGPNAPFLSGKTAQRQ